MGDLYYKGLTREEAVRLEDKLKEGYNYEEIKTPKGIGFEITNKYTGENYFYSPNSKLTLEKRYLEKDKDRKVIENYLDLLTRVAVNVASANKKYGEEIEGTANEFLEMLVKKEFVPNTPALCNAGRSLQQLSACFVLPVEDYLATDDIGEDPEKQGNGIFDALRYASMIHKSGGGTGFNFSHLRPANDGITTTFGRSSGPVSFLRAYNGSTEEVNQGGFRRGANMGILNINHPDIIEFIHEKSEKNSNKTPIRNFNLSVGVNEDFMKKAINEGYIKLINPKNEKTIPEEERIWKKDKLLKVKKFKKEEKDEENEYRRMLDEWNPSLLLDEDDITVLNRYNNQPIGKIGENNEVLLDAKILFDYVIDRAWTCGDPGLIFLDRMDRDNPTPQLGKIESTNPCGEQPLLPYEACNLGAVNLNNCVENGKFSYEKLEEIVRKGVHFLDNMIDVNKFPFKKIYKVVHDTRKIGLGLMGLADVFYKLNISYDSQEALDLAENISKFITEKARDESEKIAGKRGTFPAWEGSIYDPNSGYNIPGKTGKKVRNAAVTTIAPNGTTGMIADASGGIEPVYALALQKTCMDKTKLNYVHEFFEKTIEERGLKLDEKVIKEIKSKGKGGIGKLESFLDEEKTLFKTAHEIEPIWHVKMQAAVQKGIDNAVSKTCNLEYSATREDIKKIYLAAYELGCKGITVFRDNSLGEQVLTTEEITEKDIPKIVLRGRYDKSIDSLPGETYEQLTGCGKLFVTINRDKKGVVEIFENMNPAGGCGSAQTNSVGILASFGLHDGVDPKKVIKHLKGIRCPNSNDMIGYNSCSQALAAAIEKDMIKHEEIKQKDEEKINKIEDYKPKEIRDEEKKSTISNSVDSRCPDCGALTKKGIQGCRGESCPDCGWSNCG